jgi:hypothetical protein
MGSTTYENRGAKSTNRPRIDPNMVMTITDRAHPEHVGRNPSHYLPGDSLFDQIVADCLGTIGIIQAPLLIWIVSPKTEQNARYWLADKSKAGGGFWRVIEGSKRIEGLREANRQRVAAGGVPLMLEFDADISLASGDKVETLSHVKHVAAQRPSCPTDVGVDAPSRASSVAAVATPVFGFTTLCPTVTPDPVEDTSVSVRPFTLIRPFAFASRRMPPATPSGENSFKA